MKRLFSFITAMLMCVLPLTLVSCSAAPSADDGKIRIVTTVFPAYDFARQLLHGVQEEFELTMLLPPGSESHDFEASLSDISEIGNAELIICVGGETDGWIDSAVAASKSEAEVLRMTDMVSLYEEDTDGIFDSGHKHYHEHDEECKDSGHEHGEYDEHVWTSPANAAKIVGEICQALCRLSPDKASIYKSNEAVYTSELLELDGELRKTAENALRGTLIFADRFPFRYLTESMGVEYFAALSGCSSDSEPSLAAIYELSRKVSETGAPIIFTIEFSSGSSAGVIADETGAAVRMLHSCHNVSKADFDAGVSYLDLMRQNLQVIKEALN